MRMGDPAGRPYVSTGAARPTFLHKGLGVDRGKGTYEEALNLLLKP
jgi:hypothetical protein